MNEQNNVNRLNNIRMFMINKWKYILKKNITKFSGIYNQLNNINIEECSKQIENVIYNICFKNRVKLEFYLFCQNYVYIYLTDIFKDIYIERFLIHIYNCYIFFFR